MIIKQTEAGTKFDFAAGQMLLIDKAAGITSFGVVSRVRKIVSVKKVGHSGTLDPAATGLLILCTGKKTKELHNLQGFDKTYEGIIRLGIRTESMDGESDIVEEKDTGYVTREMIEQAVEKFRGEIEQLPPMYSALKHKGKALYKYARKGEEVERTPRKVNIFSFDIQDISMPDVSFRIRCSKGTYIRVIADDLGKELGCGAYLKQLRRTAIGEYNVDDSLTIEELDELVNRSEAGNLEK